MATDVVGIKENNKSMMLLLWEFQDSWDGGCKIGDESILVFLNKKKFDDFF